MAEFVTVAKVGDIPDGQGVAYPVNGRMVAVFHEAGKYEAIDDFCPHMGASLAGGFVENGVVICPWHAWRFKTCDGTWCDNPSISIDSFDVRVDGDEIQVCVPDKETPAAEAPGAEAPAAEAPAQSESPEAEDSTEQADQPDDTDP